MDDLLIQQKQQRIALVICDVQHEILASLENSLSLPQLLSATRIAIEAARNNKWMVIHSGLKFQSRYNGVNRNHKLYGALRKLNDKLGNDDKVHFFMSGWPGCEFVLLVAEEDRTIWRSSHLPHELVDALVQQQITKVFLVGVKASIAIQIASQMIMDQGIDVAVIRECVQDDDESRLQATLNHLLPLFSTVISLEEVIVDNAGGFDSLSVESKENFIRLIGKGYSNAGSTGHGKQELSSKEDSTTLHACDCGRRGLGGRYMELLLRRRGWKTYPTQTWYEDFIAGDFHCPLFKKICDFCDEPEFSKVSMYLYGREFLDEKDRVIELAGRFMPKTYRIQEGLWVGGESPPLEDDNHADGAQDAPWFIKIADQNLGGAAIDIVQKPSEIMNYVHKNQRYVVQQHVIDPLLTDDGRKCHVKFYVLLICQEDGVTWNLYTYKASLLSISPNPWSVDDLSKETQITIHRHHIPPGETIGWKQHWDVVYKKCQVGTAEVIEKAIASGKLKGRRRGSLAPQKQFEVFSVDWMPDTHGNIWMFEFNMSPAVWARNEEFDGLANDGDERRSSLMKHDELMLQEALSVVIPDGSGPGQWEHVALNYNCA